MFCFLIMLVVYECFANRPSVTISDGTLVGINMQTWMGRNMDAFLGIPYAAPPIGNYRFMPPQPVTPWNGKQDAGTHGGFCTQFTPTSEVIGVENCLFLNVYTPSYLGTKLLPVIFFIHPSAFMIGSGSNFGPRYLLDYNLTLVTLNYRLGILGFLSTEDSVVPGNMGLKDQVAALIWVRNNIRAFGGNPEDITIAGASSGGISVQYHFMSRLSRGLFKRGICLSGTTLLPIGIMREPIFKNRRVAAAVDCPYSSSETLVNCLRRIPANRLVAQEGSFQNFYYTPFQIFGPTVERVGSPGAFITQTPYEALRTGEFQNSPILFSTSSQEGLVPVGFFIANQTGLSYLSKNWLSVFPSLLDYLYTVPRAEVNTTSITIYNYYFGNNSISLATNQTLIEMVGDRDFTNDIETAARIQAYSQSSPVYFYRFSYRGQYSVTNVLTGNNINYGVAHTDDLLYIMNNTFLPPSENTPSDRQMINIMAGIWASFTINGTPTIRHRSRWQPMDRANAMSGPLTYLMIHSPSSININQTNTLGHSQFWNSLPLNEGSSGRPVYSSI